MIMSHALVLRNMVTCLRALRCKDDMRLGDLLANAGKEIAKEDCTISCIAITHLNPEIVGTLAAVVRSINTPKDTPLQLRMSNPARAVLQSKLNDSGCEILGDESKVKIETVKEDSTISFGRRELQCFTASTPRYPELLCLYERTTRRLFSSCFFSAHVNPQAGMQGAPIATFWASCALACCTPVGASCCKTNNMRNACSQRLSTKVEVWAKKPELRAAVQARTAWTAAAGPSTAPTGAFSSTACSPLW